MSEPHHLIDHLFRHESGKLVSILTKIFGPHNVELAEDVVQDTLIKALENWKFHGVPANPSGWLFTAARNKALDVIRRDRYTKEFAAYISPLLKSEYTASTMLQQLVNENLIEDEQLRMMFVCCHPSIAEEGQVAMILKTLCGFSVSEIAKAFITSEETITKRLYRARQQFRTEKVAFELPSSNDLNVRLGNVLTSVYLIFNEGYNSSNNDSLVREDLIEESLRLAKMLVEHPLTRQPQSLALTSLLCFQAARVHGRVDKSGLLIQLKHQDRSGWNRELIDLGIKYLQEASTGEIVSSYHLDAAIAHEHCVALTYEKTDWNKIIELYNWRFTMKPDPLTALNRLIAFAEVNGPQKALDEIQRMPDKDLLKNYYIYPFALGEWHSRLGNKDDARRYFERAKELTNSPREKDFLANRIEQLK